VKLFQILDSKSLPPILEKTFHNQILQHRLNGARLVFAIAFRIRRPQSGGRIGCTNARTQLLTFDQ
jgi:hypothetical protein